MTISEYLMGADLTQKVSSLNTNHDKAAEVFTQASRHCTRSDLSEFYSIVRPNEEEVFTKWRQENKRSITTAPILSFKRMMTRVLRSSIKLPEVDKELFDNLDDFLYDEIIMLSLIDTNAIGIEWPFNPEDPTIPLAAPGAYPQNMPLDSETVIYHYDKVAHVSKDFVILFDGMVNIGTKEKPEEQPRYIACDKTNYYRINPRKKDKEVVYDLVTWYMHDLKRLPVFFVPGVVMKDGYRETIAWAAYEFLDEAVIALSSDQISRIRHALPKLVVNAEITCPTCNGAAKIEVKGSNIPQVCKTCNGAGHLKEIGDFGTLKVRSRSEFDRNNTNPIYYVQNPGDISYTKKVWEDLIEKAEKQLCTDLLEGSGNESGIAKELRLEPRQDLLVMYGEQFCKFVEAYINNRVQIRNAREEFKTIVPPSYYETKTPDMLKMYVTQSLPAERQREYLMYIKSKYRGNDYMENVHVKAMLYAPLLLYNQEEADQVIAMGAYDANDIKRRDYAIFILGEILMKNENNEKIENKKLFEEADKMLIELGIMDDPAAGPGELNIDDITNVDDLPDDLDELEEVLSKLLNGEIDRESAKKLVMVIEDIDDDEAEELLTDTGL